MIPPSSHSAYGFKPRLQPSANGSSSSFGSVQSRRIQDQVHFGNGQTEAGPVRYQQHGPSWVLEKYPVTGNNCQICSVKNMLRHFGLQPAAIEDIMDKGLKPFLLEEIPVPNNPGLKHKRGLFIDDPDYPERYEINPEALREFLTGKLGMRLDQGLTLGLQNNNRDEETQRQFLDQCVEICGATSPLLIGLGSNVPNPNGTRTGQKYGHAIFAYPVPGADTWHIVDSEKDQISILSRDAFENYILNSAYQHQVQLFRVLEGPKPEKIAQFSRPEASPETTGSVKTPSESVEEPKPLEESSEAPEIASPIETPSETAKTPKPSSAQETEAKPEQSKPGWTQRLGQWFKDQWNSLTQSLKRFGNWIKSWFSSNKKAD